MKLPNGHPVMQHQFSVTFNGEPVEGLTEWIDGVSIDYIEQKIGLSIILAYDKDPHNTLSHQKLVSVLGPVGATMELLTLGPDNEVVCKETFCNLKVAELCRGVNACLVSGDNSSVADAADEENLDDMPRRVSMFANPVYVSASVKFEVNKP